MGKSVKLAKTANSPAFHAFHTSTQVTAIGGWTKVACDGELFDTNDCYNNTTHRFTPNVAGYYQVNTAVHTQLLNNISVSALYKNGVWLVELDRAIPSAPVTLSGSTLVYCNGTTDYLEFYVYTSAISTIGITNPALTWWNAVLVKAD